VGEKEGAISKPRNKGVETHNVDGKKKERPCAQLRLDNGYCWQRMSIGKFLGESHRTLNWVKKEGRYSQPGKKER